VGGVSMLGLPEWMSERVSAENLAVDCGFSATRQRNGTIGCACQR